MLPVTRDQVSTANFFQQFGYGQNPLAIANEVIAKLLAATEQKINKNNKLPGAGDPAAAF